MKSYPRLKSFGFAPAHIELRYIDVFDKDLIGTVDLFEFAANATTLHIALPEFMMAEPFQTTDIRARIQAGFKLEKRKYSVFSFDYGSGTNAEVEIMRLESKVISNSADIPKMRLGRASSLDEVKKWLEESHEVTSAFFKSFVRSNILEKFK
jgi:hypothetical protein